MQGSIQSREEYQYLAVVIMAIAFAHKIWKNIIPSDQSHRDIWESSWNSNGLFANSYLVDNVILSTNFLLSYLRTMLATKFDPLRIQRWQKLALKLIKLFPIIDIKVIAHAHSQHKAKAWKTFE